MNEQDLLELHELQRLTRELLDHLTEMFPVEEVAELLHNEATEGGPGLPHAAGGEARTARGGEDIAGAGGRA